MMKVEARRVLMRILIDILDTPGVERRRPTLQAVHDIALFKQQPRQIGAVLAGKARDECCFGHIYLRILGRCSLATRVVVVALFAARPFLEWLPHYLCP